MSIPVPELHDDIFDERITTFGRLHEAHARLHQTFGRSLEEAHGLSNGSFEALLRIGRSPDQRLIMRELAEQVALTTGGVTRLVDRLVEAGYVERCGDPADRRVNYIQLTDEGRRKLEAAVGSHLSDLDAELFARLDSKEVAELNRIMDKLR